MKLYLTKFLLIDILSECHKPIILRAQKDKNMKKTFLVLALTICFSLTSISDLFAAEKVIKQPPHKSLSRVEGDVGIIVLEGEINHDSAAVVFQAYEKFKKIGVNVVIIRLHSMGGSLSAGKRIIDSMDYMKNLNVPVLTFVDYENYCASVCTVIFANGTSRIGALNSIWLFHSPYVKEGENNYSKEEISNAVTSARQFLMSIYLKADPKWSEKVLRPAIETANKNTIFVGLQIADQSETWFTHLIAE